MPCIVWWEIDFFFGFNSNLTFKFMIKFAYVLQHSPVDGLICFYTTSEVSQTETILHSQFV